MLVMLGDSIANTVCMNIDDIVLVGKLQYTEEGSPFFPIMLANSHTVGAVYQDYEEAERQKANLLKQLQENNSDSVDGEDYVDKSVGE